MFCTVRNVLYCRILYCTVLYCTVLYCNRLYGSVLYCTVQSHTVLICSADVPGKYEFFAKMFNSRVFFSERKKKNKKRKFFKYSAVRDTGFRKKK